jgi:hypothetical protein
LAQRQEPPWAHPHWQAGAEAASRQPQVQPVPMQEAQRQGEVSTFMFMGSEWRGPEVVHGAHSRDAIEARLERSG